MATAVRVISCVSWRKLGNFKKTQNGKKPHPGTTFIHICCINLVKERVGNIIARQQLGLNKNPTDFKIRYWF